MEILNVVFILTKEKDLHPSPKFKSRFASARRPGKQPSAENMKMQMRHALLSVFSAVDDHAIAGIGYS